MSQPTDPAQTPNPYWPAQMQPPPYAPTSDAGQPPVPPQPPAGHPYSPGPYPPPYAPLIRPTSGMATASMIFGIAGLFLFITVIPSLVAVLCGHNAIKETKNGYKAGHGQAIAGLILGYLVVGPAVLFIVVWAFGLIFELLFQ